MTALASSLRDAEGADTRATWSALGTYVDLRVERAEVLGTAARVASAVLDEVDRTCSRFRPDSDLTWANERAGRWTAAPPLLVAAVRGALVAAEATGGLVDPTLGGLLVAAGYDRTLARVRASTSPVALPDGGPTWRDVEVRESAVRVPTGARLDLGATGKAFAADLVAGQVAETLATGVIVSVGGDVSVAGTDPSGPGWPVAVTETHPRRPGDDTGQTVALVEGGLATSTVLARTWARGGRRWHHIFDPRTRLPATVHWRTVTAAGRSAEAANTASTAAVVLGVDAVPWLEAHGVSARLVRGDGTVLTCGDWPAGTTSEPDPTPSRKELS